MRTRLMTMLMMVASLLMSGQALTQPQLPNFQSGDVLRANDLNRIVEQVRRNMNASGGSGGGATHTVDCPSGTIAAAMSQAQPGDTIRISGTCREAVVVDKDGITLDGRGSAVVDGSNADAAAILIQGRQNVTVKGLTVQNGLNGIKIVGGAAAWLEDVTVRGSRVREGHANGDGISVGDSASVVLTGAIVANDNAGRGILVWNSSSAIVNGNVVVDGKPLPRATLQANGNGDMGILVGMSSALSAFGGDRAPTTIEANDNGLSGIQLVHSSSVHFGPGANVEVSDNADNGLLVDSSSSAIFFADTNGGYTGTFNRNGGDGIHIANSSAFSAWDFGLAASLTMTNNGASGLTVGGGSSARINVTNRIASNGYHGIAIGSSHVEIFDSTIENNAGPGVGVYYSSTLQSHRFSERGGITVTGNSKGITTWTNCGLDLDDSTITDNSDYDVELFFSSHLFTSGNTIIGNLWCDHTAQSWGLSEGRELCPEPSDYGSGE